MSTEYDNSRLEREEARGEDEFKMTEPKFSKGDQVRFCANSQRILRDVCQVGYWDANGIILNDCEQDNGRGEPIYRVSWDQEQGEHLTFAETHLELI